MGSKPKSVKAPKFDPAGDLSKMLSAYQQSMPGILSFEQQYRPEFQDLNLQDVSQFGLGMLGLSPQFTQGAAEQLGAARGSELGQMTDQAGMTRGLMEGLSPEQAAQVTSMQDLASQAADAEGAYAGRMGEALGTYGVRPQTFDPTIQAAEQDASMANQMAQEAYARRGTLSAQEQRSAQQTAREAAQSAGRLGGNAAIASEIQNRESALAGRRAQASQAGQQAFEQRQNLANLRLQEQQGLFGQRLAGAQATADMQQAGLGQLQDIEKMRMGLRGLAGDEAMRAYQAAGGFYTQPGLQLLGSQPLSYQVGNQMMGLGLDAIGAGKPQLFDVGSALNLGAAQRQNIVNAQAANAQARASYSSGLFGGLGALGGGLASGIGAAGGIGAFMASDRRLKTDIEKVGKTDAGLPIYTYKYKGDNKTQMGVMAQDVEKKTPKAVKEVGGFKAVNYALVK
jgi:hypothetical protein